MRQAETGREVLIPEVLTPKDLTKRQQSVKKRFMPKYLSPDEVQHGLRGIKEPQEKMLCLFLWTTGCRISEALAVSRQDLDLVNRLCTIRWLKSRKYHERVIPLHQSIVDVLAMYSGTMNGPDKLFPFTRQRAWQIVNKHFKAHPHTLRHSFAVNYLRQGGRLTDLQQLLGHKTLNNTAIYTRLVPTELGTELNKINFS